MTALRAANLALKFALELASVAAFAVWGAHVADGVVSVLLAAGLATAGIVLWGIFAAPKSSRRLPDRGRIPFELGFFALAFAALLAVGAGLAAAVFGVAVVVNAVLLSVFGDWHQ